MLEVLATGSPHTIGLTHGTTAKFSIHGSITFYKALFQSKCKMGWPTVKSFALKYQSYLEQNFPQYIEEMSGVAEGAGVSYEDILALNVRTEIAFGAFNDGCTAISWKSWGKSVLGQNWDWNTDRTERQAQNLICLKISKEDGTKLQMITEAGILGKIGLNSHGVGVTLNAIKSKGVSFSKLPCHLALRTVMESSSRAAAVRTLQKQGVASACHILVADVTGGTGLECSSEDIVPLEMDERGVVTHTNHYIQPHKETVIESHDWLPDTNFRLRRIGELMNQAANEQGPSMELVGSLLRDEMEGDGAAICRSQNGTDGLATLFSIVMDLGERRASVCVGRPADPMERLGLNP